MSCRKIVAQTILTEVKTTSVVVVVCSINVFLQEFRAKHFEEELQNCSHSFPISLAALLEQFSARVVK